MPLNFDEPLGESWKGAKKDERKELAPKRSGAPLQLDTQVLPQLIRKVGDWKSGRISQSQVESYMDRHTLVFDRELLTKMFAEADYQKEGSLDARALSIAISGRFPKREHTQDWRTLTALLLGLQELFLADDPEVTRAYVHERPAGGGTYNHGGAVWDGPPQPLPPVRRRSAKSRAQSAGEPKGEWQVTQAALASTLSAGGSYSTAGSLTGTLQSSVGDGTIRTVGGLKQLGQIEAELRVNGELQAGEHSEGAQGRSTFSAAKEFDAFSRGLELVPQLSVDTAGRGPGGTASFLGVPKESVRAWSATLPPTAISLPRSSLQTLRYSIRSTAAGKPDFLRRHKPLNSGELDLKKTMGAELDVQMSLARVEPVRDTKVLYNADYVTWGGYAANCRTSPDRWYNNHPASAGQSVAEHKYPWG